MQIEWYSRCTLPLKMEQRIVLRRTALNLAQCQKQLFEIILAAFQTCVNFTDKIKATTK